MPHGTHPGDQLLTLQHSGSAELIADQGAGPTQSCGWQTTLWFTARPLPSLTWTTLAISGYNTQVLSFPKRMHSLISFQKILHLLNNISIIYNMIQKYIYIFTLFNKKIYNSIFPLQRGHSNPLKIKGNIHVKAALSFWMKCGEYHKIQT